MKRTKFPIDDHLKIIRKIAWNLHYVSRMDYDDLFSEGCLQYLLRMNRFYDRNKKAKYTTYLWTTIWTALITYIKEQSSFPHTELTDEIISNLGEYPTHPKINKVPIKEKYYCGEYRMF